MVERALTFLEQLVLLLSTERHVDHGSLNRLFEQLVGHLEGRRVAGPGAQVDVREQVARDGRVAERENTLVSRREPREM